MVRAYEDALFHWHDAAGNLIGILAMHVDDFIFCGNESFKKNVISELKKIFRVGTFNFWWGLYLIQSKDGIIIDTHYPYYQQK